VAKHLFPTRHANCACIWCGRHDDEECGATDAMRAAVRTFATIHGKAWKSKLRRMRDQKRPIPAQLRRLIETIGMDQLGRLAGKDVR